MANMIVNNTVKFHWSQINPIPDPNHGVPCERSSHGLSLIKNGTILFLHGGEQVARTPVEASQTTWIAVQVECNKDVWAWRCIGTDVCPPARVAHAQAVYKDSQIYIFGGRAGISMGEAAMNDLWRLDSSSRTWTLVKPDLEHGDAPPEVRSFHKMVCIGSSLYVFGGCGVNGRLADLHRFDIRKKTWHTLSPSSLLKGRGGANFLPFASSKLLGVVGGFAGQESNDGHLFDIETQQWQEQDINKKLTGLRPRSVCVSASFPSLGVSVIFGGEVDPSEKGHEGAGGFENDLVLLEEKTGTYISTDPSDESFPETRGWSDGASIDDEYDGSSGGGGGKLYIYGGLSGNDTKPRRLDDLWCLNISKA
ncbi:galactose oxidase [Fragilariopsis cylindrus CCMP1102]|uniref:Galactose oxidase n=1 Tax=Fragilariopsis cylindrus CCMP1102 TaxID=635003 RepID=A0A1E7EKT6_9STRA|nr:galactose oxidase [Fragilariopsis cylindrus CCMP1102]|eukprot:OEU06467.1 galactose oxidase [Fragilariopsis cylindrus CCMP1102]